MQQDRGEETSGVQMYQPVTTFPMIMPQLLHSANNYVTTPPVLQQPEVNMVPVVLGDE